MTTNTTSTLKQAYPPPSTKETLAFLQQELSCPICLCTLSEPVSTPCCHVFCNSCILECLRVGGSSAQCALCKQRIIKRSLVPSEQMANLVASYESVLQAYQQDTGEPFVANAHASGYSQSVPLEDLSQRFPPLHKAVEVSKQPELITNSHDYLRAIRLLKSHLTE
jgi:hypothetical protein